MRLFWELTRLSIQRHITYRAATLAGFLTNVFFGLLRAAVLVALYGARQEVSGMSVQDAITYTGISQAVIAFLSLFSWYDIMRSVYSGQIGSDLLKPMGYFSFWMAHDLGRALVNLVAPPAGTLLDPCCGSGAILLEARSLGLQIFGSDLNQVMVNMARKNLAHFGYDGRVERSDAREVRQRADALVTDLPYGRLLQANETVIRAIFQRAVKLAPAAVYVAGQDLSAWLSAAGYQQIQVFTVAKHNRVARYVHLARV